MKDDEKNILEALELFCKASFQCKTIDDVRDLYDVSSKIGQAYPYLAGVIQSHAFVLKSEILNSKRNAGGGHVYVIQYKSGLVKIGKTINPKQRLDALKTMTASKIKRSFVSPFITKPTALESKTHKHFRANRMHGEFFKISFDEAVGFINQTINNPD